MVSSSLSFIVADGRFGLSKLGNYMKLTKHAAMQPPTKARPGLYCLGCGCTQAGSPGHRLCQVGWWLGLGPSYVGVLSR